MPGIEDILRGYGIQAVYPDARDTWIPLSIFDDVQARKYHLDKERAERVNSILMKINNSRLSSSPVIGAGKVKVLKGFYAPNNRESQTVFESFMDFMNRATNPNSKHNAFIAFDIESIGDRELAKGQGFAVTEIAAQGFKRGADGTYHLHPETSFNMLIAPDEDSIVEAQKLIEKVKRDPRSFRSLSQSQKVTLINLMRYSTKGEGELSGALLETNKPIHTIKHNPIADSLLRPDGSIDESKFVRHFGMYIQHIEKGLEDLVQYGVKDQKKVIESFNSFLRKNRYKYFISHNGMNFDIPALADWSKKFGVSISGPSKHIDYLRLIQTVYPNLKEMHEGFGRDFSEKRASYGLGTLQEIRKTLFPHADLSQAHNAMYDIGEEGLGGAFAHTFRQIHERIMAGKLDQSHPSGFQFHPAELTWTDAVLKKGDLLFATGGAYAYGEDSLDFQATKTEEGFVAESPDFNKTVINSKTFYEVKGIRNLSEEGVTRYALELYDKENDRHAFIVREGENAMSQIAEFVQRRFYNWNGLSKEMKRRIRYEKEVDLARRRYERLFTVAGGGGENVATQGFQAAKRMFQNMRIFKERRLELKGANIERTLDLMGLQGEERDVAKGELIKKRISHDELMKLLDFNSLPGGKFNLEEAVAFFRMAPRMLDELPYFEKAIEAIEKSIPIKESMSEEEARQARQKRDIAWRFYAQYVDEKVGEHADHRPLLEFEQRHLRFKDRLNRNGNELYINFENLETARNSIYNIIRKNKEEDLSIQRERLTNLILSMQEAKIINEATANRFHAYNRQYALNDTIMNIVNELMDSHAIIQQSLKVKSMKRRDSISRLTIEENEKLIQNAIKQANGFRGYIMLHGKQANTTFSENIDELFKYLDRPRRSGLKPNNAEAIKHILSSYKEAVAAAGDESLFGLNFALSVNQEGTQAKITIYKPKNSASVVDSIIAGKTPSQAAELIVPLINENGTHVYGNQVFDARSFAINEGRKSKIISSVEMIARGYTDSRVMHDIIRSVRLDDYEEANTIAKRTLREEINELSGIKRNIGFNDSYRWLNNQSDWLKQGHVTIAPAMIEDWLNTVGEDGNPLLESKYVDPEMLYQDPSGRWRVNRHATFEDVHPQKAWEMLREMDDWAKKKGWSLYANSNKAELVARGIMNYINVQDLHTYGHYTFQGRDNSVQWLNAYHINDETAARLEQIKGVSFRSTVTTALQRDWDQARGDRVGVQAKVAYMTQEELQKRLEQLAKDSAEARRLMEKAGILKNGKFDPILTPRLYEQQAVFADEFLHAWEVDNPTFLDKGTDPSTFEWSKEFYNENTKSLRKTRVKPGDFLGFQYVNGAKLPVYYEGKLEGEIFTGAHENRIGIRTTESPFKFMIGGEKTTDGPAISRRLMQLITGADDVVAIYNPNVAKHKDLGMILTGQAKLVGEAVMKLDAEKRQQAIDIIHKSNVGLQWDGNQFLVTAKTQKFKGDEFDRLFVELNEKVGTRLQSQVTHTIGDQEYRTDIGIQEIRASQVQNYSRMTDETGQVVLRVNADGKKVYAGNQPDELGEVKDPRIKGVTWSHREMGVLKHLGASLTYEHVFNIMMQNATKNLRAEESKNMIAALASFVSSEEQWDRLGISDKTLTVHDFEALPSLDRNKYSIRGTIFDPDHLQEKLGGEIGSGFWLELPTVNGEGYTFLETVHHEGFGDKKENRVQIKDNKIFIPFTRQEGKGNNIYLKQLQNHIASIYRRAAAVENAKSEKEARIAHQHLQKAIDDYVNHLGYSITASHGQTFESVFKAHMPTSGSGIFKLIPVDASVDLADEFTFINEEDAKKLGVYDELMEKEAKRAAGETVEDLMVMNVRYPTFHDNAMQITKLRIGKGVKPGEFHTTALASALMKADSDGDYDNIVVIQDKRVQEEWRNIYEREKRKRMARQEKAFANYQDFLKQELADQITADRKFDLKSLAGEEGIKNFLANTMDEVAAKAGKMVIGHASNLNYAMRQLADTYLAHDEKARQSIFDFGQMLEQKLISSKHGAQDLDYAFEFINKIYSANNDGDWKRVHELDRMFFEGKNAEAIEHLRSIKHNIREGLYNPSLKFGTSSGVSVERVGVRGLTDYLLGNTRPEDVAHSNAALSLIHKFLGVQDPYSNGINPMEEPQDRPKVDPYRISELKEGESRINGPAGFFSESFEDLTGGTLKQETYEKVKQALTSFFDGEHGKRNRRLALLGGLALGGVIGYNTLSDDPIVEPYNLPSRSNDPYLANASSASNYGGTPAPALAPLDEGQNGAIINISAKGRGQNPNALTSAVAEGLRQSNYSSGKINMTVNHTDNTAKLNRIWYRDKVEQYT
jgi:DNA polymerase III epsilon subunit-like protein